MSDRVRLETLAFEHEVLTASNRTLEAKLALVTAERDRLKATLAAIEQSRPWRLTQALRGLMGRRW